VTSREQTITVLVRALSPYLGATMATASARGLCERFVRDGSPLDQAGFDAILAALEPGLHVYVGHEKTQAILREIGAGVRAIGGSW
jgi:hypothetical protein